MMIDSLMFFSGALISFIGQIVVWLITNQISVILIFLIIINSIFTYLSMKKIK